jgi:hypothetical protein
MNETICHEPPVSLPPKRKEGLFCTENNVSSDVVRAHHVTRHNTPIHNILSTAPQLSISQKALGTLSEDGNVMPRHVGDTMNN